MIATDLTQDTRLPATVHDLAVRLGANPDAAAPIVRLKQTGRMKPNLSATSWMPFTATQTISTRTCAFDWRARAGPLGMVSARDALMDGEGRLDVIALGFIPIARAAHTPALVRGELMRYLAELPWAPDAILHNTELRWRKDSPDALTVSAGSGDTASEVVLSLDSEGRIAGGFAADRPRSATAPILPTPWRGRFSDYRWHKGRWLPFAGEVAWEIDGKEIVYWQGRIERWAMDGEAPDQQLLAAVRKANKMASSELSRRSRASVEPSPPRRRSRKAETKVAFVTGASSGLGAEISLKLARRNWIVYAASRRGTRTDGVDNLHGLSVDVTDGAAVTAAIGRIFAEHGRLDAVIANAGVNASAPFEEIPAAAGRSIFETNFWGTVHVARAALPIMRRQRQGLILTTGSLAGLIGPPGEAFYAASKHALEGFLEALQYEVRPFGVRVVLVEPGFIRTNFAKSMAPIAAAIADYAELRTQLDAHWRKSIENGMAVGVVAERIVRAVESGRARFRLSIGTDAFFVPALKRLLPEQLFFSVVRRAFGIDGVRAKDKRRPVAVQEQQR